MNDVISFLASFVADRGFFFVGSPILHRKAKTVTPIDQTKFSKGMNLQDLGEKIFRRLWGRRSLAAVLGLVMLPLSLVAMRGLSASPPLAAFERARVALSTARRTRAPVYAPELLAAAETRWQQATQAWGNENKRWFFRRDFQAALALANAVHLQAQKAESLAIAVRDSLQFAAAAELTVVKQKIDVFKSDFGRVPVASALRQKFVAGELLMIESEYAFNRQDYRQAVAKVQTAAALVGSAGTDATKLLQAYLAQVPQWKKWAAETKTWSDEQNAVAIIVDKMAHRCYVYGDGRLQAEYAVDLGPRWLGHKKQKGDGATPEGHYRVTKKKGPGLTKYYKALEIDYPNETDRQNFLAAQKKGELSRSAHIGGLIEIHGDGGKGLNWTSGCVALRNQDMDEVFALARIGTRVTIVGALTETPVVSRTAIALAKKDLNGAAPLKISSP
jgi:lipoprotein-anchoring transpeptidase ErfK/SrfK